MTMSVLLPPTCSDGNANQVVYESKDEVDSDPLDRFLGQIDTGDHIQQIILTHGGEREATFR